HAARCGVRYRAITGFSCRTCTLNPMTYCAGAAGVAGAGCIGSAGCDAAADADASEFSAGWDGGVAQPGSPPDWRNSSSRLAMSALSCATTAVLSSIFVFESFKSEREYSCLSAAVGSV